MKPAESFNACEKAAEYSPSCAKSGEAVHNPAKDRSHVIEDTESLVKLAGKRCIAKSPDTSVMHGVKY